MADFVYTLCILLKSCCLFIFSAVHELGWRVVLLMDLLINKYSNRLVVVLLWVPFKQTEVVRSKWGLQQNVAMWSASLLEMGTKQK